MQMYTSPNRINGSWREILIYKSIEPLNFESFEKHTQTDEQGNNTIVITYITEPFVYREFAPTEQDEHYYYWFILRSTEKQIITSNSERVAVLEEQIVSLDETVIGLFEANAAMEEQLTSLDETAIALYEISENQEATNIAQDEALIELYELTAQ